MKSIIAKTVLFISMSICSVSAFAQPKVAVLNFDAKHILLDPAQVGNLARIELTKLKKFQVMDIYDINYIMDKNKKTYTDCYGKLCLVDLGKMLEADKCLTGSIELYGESIVVTIRLIDITTNSIEMSHIKSFLNLQNQISSMLQISLQEMFQLPVDANLEGTLTKKSNLNNSINTPKKDKISLAGPRMGVTFFTGKTAEILQKDRKEGGFDAYPLMSQFGYQFEQQYLSEGNFQALFEFIPMISGIDQGMFLPSLSILNGLRNNKYGWEIALGPTIFVAKESEYYKVGEEDFKREDELTYEQLEQKHTYSSYTELDSKGSLKIRSGFIIACGKTFVSGKLNIPVNAYITPNKNGLRFGISVGYNSKK